MNHEVICSGQHCKEADALPKEILQGALGGSSKSFFPFFNNWLLHPSSSKLKHLYRCPWLRGWD